MGDMNGRVYNNKKVIQRESTNNKRLKNILCVVKDSWQIQSVSIRKICNRLFLVCTKSLKIFKNKMTGRNRNRPLLGMD